MTAQERISARQRERDAAEISQDIDRIMERALEKNPPQDKDSNPPEPPAVNLGHFTVESAFKLCQEVQRRYGIRLSCLSLTASGGKCKEQVVFLDGATDSRTRGCIKRLAKRFAS